MIDLVGKDTVEQHLTKLFLRKQGRISGLHQSPQTLTFAANFSPLTISSYGGYF
jgi:hypothetical protein